MLCRNNKVWQPLAVGSLASQSSISGAVADLVAAVTSGWQPSQPNPTCKASCSARATAMPDRCRAHLLSSPSRSLVATVCRSVMHRNLVLRLFAAARYLTGEPWSRSIWRQGLPLGLR